MASEELIQGFNTVRSYIRSFFIYGYKSRPDFLKFVKDRTYGDYLHKIDNWLGSFSLETKNANKESIHYLQVDSHKITSNPFYESLKTRIFKNNQIAFHFYIIDALKKKPNGLTQADLHSEVQNNSSPGDANAVIDITDDQFRHLLDEYEKLGILKCSKTRPKIYTLNDDIEITPSILNAIQFFSETSDLGFFGSTLLDLQDEVPKSPFVFKHHYLSHALNTEITYQLLQAIQNQRVLKLNCYDSQNITEVNESSIIVPLKIYRSVETGRSYLLSYYCEKHNYNFCFLDNIESVEKLSSKITIESNAQIIYTKKIACCANFQELLADSKEFTDHVWGISTIACNAVPSRVEVIFHVDDNESYILNRLQREKRQGKIEKLGPTSYKFSITLTDPIEIIPWLRSYIMRIININFEDKEIEQRFLNDFKSMMSLYDIKEEQQCLKQIV